MESGMGSTFAVGWGTLSLINAGLAQSKGRAGMTWWFISLLLGPIATFLIVIMERTDAPRESAADSKVA